MDVVLCRGSVCLTTKTIAHNRIESLKGKKQGDQDRSYLRWEIYEGNLLIRRKKRWFIYGESVDEILVCLNLRCYQHLVFLEP